MVTKKNKKQVKEENKKPDNTAYFQALKYVMNEEPEF